ncbi:MAG: hypothetical protein QOG28_1284 [Trebonia sp.]|jgi:hypothetical protein|nr:hypothetical protein [Actinomycetes bacterium]MDX6416664.1 hypothetical protein [Trebonia sp.]
MVEAARTTASTGATWAIVIVAVSVLAFWLIAVYLADRSQVRASGRARAATYTGAWAGGSVAGEQAAEIPEEAVHEPIVTPGRHVRDKPNPQGEAPTRADVPAQPGEAPAQPAAETGRHAMPTQRTGDADRAERSRAGQGTPDEEDPGR